MKKTLALMLSLVFAMSAVATCGSSGNPASTTAGSQPSAATAATGANASGEAADDGAAPADGADARGAITIGVNSDWVDISPFGPMTSSTRAYVTCNFYEHLLLRSNFGAPLEEMELQCAKSIEKIDDLTYQVEMYDYIADTAGNNITAEDYAWCAATMLDSGNYEKLNAYLSGVTATGEYAVQIKLSENALSAIEYILDIIPVLSRKAYEDSENGMSTKPVATGPYQVQSMVPGSTLTLVKNESYWQADAALQTSFAPQNVDKVVFSVIMEPSQMAIALQSGNIDMAQFMDNSVLDQFYKDGVAADGTEVFELFNSIMFSILPNMSAPNSILAGDQALREAIYYAIDTEAIVQGTVNGLGAPLNAMANSIAGDYIAAWDDRDYFGYSVDTAKAKLADSSYNGEALRLMTSSGFEKPAQIVQAELAEVGIKSDILVYEGALYQTYKLDPAQWDLMFDIKGTDDFVTFPWSLLFDANSFGGMTANFIADDELQSAILAATNADTHSSETVAAVEEILEKNAYCYGLYTINNYIVAKSGIVAEMAYFRDSAILPGATAYLG